MKAFSRFNQTWFESELGPNIQVSNYISSDAVIRILKFPRSCPCVKIPMVFSFALEDKCSTSVQLKLYSVRLRFEGAEVVSGDLDSTGSLIVDLGLISLHLALH